MKILKYKSDILAYISSIIIIIGTFLPIVIIDGVSKAFIAENGKLVLACAIISVILYLFKVGFFSFIPAIGSLLILLIFYLGINDSMIVLNTVNPNSATYGTGIYLILIGSILLIISSIINFIDNRKKKENITEDFSMENSTSEEKVENESFQKNNEFEKNDIPLEDSIMNNLENLNDIKEPEEQIQFKNCEYCGAIIRIESDVCSFCNSKTNDNNV